jgi:hypothetical protein
VLRFIAYFLSTTAAGGKFKLLTPARVSRNSDGYRVVKFLRTPFVAENIRMGGAVSTRERRFELQTQTVQIVQAVQPLRSVQIV